MTLLESFSSYFFLSSPAMYNNSFSEADFPGKCCLFSESSSLTALCPELVSLC